MKKIILSLLFLFFVTGIVYGKTVETQTLYSRQLDIIGETVATASYVKWDVNNAGIYTNIRFTETSATTANLRYLNSAGTVMESVTISRGANYLINGYSNISLVIYNTSGAPRAFNGSITLAESDVSYKQRRKSNLSFTVSTASTTVTVTAATQGYWLLQPKENIYLDIMGTTPDSSDFYVSQNSVLITPYLYSGDVVKMIGVTATGNVSGFVYE